MRYDIDWSQYLEDDIFETKGIRAALSAHLENVGADSFAAFAFLLITWIPLVVIARWSIPYETGIQAYSVIFTLSGLFVISGYILSRTYQSLRTALLLFTPPYDTSEIMFRIPDSKNDSRSGSIKAISRAWLAVGTGTCFLICVTLYSLIVGVVFSLLSDPVDQISSVYHSIPAWVSQPVLETVSNYTGIAVTTITSKIHDPAVVTLLILTYGPLFLFGVLSSWNYMYALRIASRKLYKQI